MSDKILELSDENWKLRRLVATFYRLTQKEYLRDSMVDMMKEAKKVADQMKPGTPCRATCGAIARTIGYDGAWCVYVSSMTKEICCDRVAGSTAQTELPLVASRSSVEPPPGSGERVLPTDAEVSAATSVLVKMAMTRP